MCACEQGTCWGDCPCGCSHTLFAPSYDASDWKPGDVAIVRAPGMGPIVAQMGAERAWVWVDTGGRNPQGMGQACYAHESAVIEARPVATIDYEDAEQVRSLQKALYDYGRAPISAWPVEHVQEALREFARPTPRIEEPAGQFAVVEAEDGRRWYRDGDPSESDCRWRQVRNDCVHARNTWREVAAGAVRILSPGVTS